MPSSIILQGYGGGSGGNSSSGSAGLAYVYCTADDVAVLQSIDGVDGRLDDDADGVVNPVEAAYLTKIIAWASGRANIYLGTRYAFADLAQSTTVNYWTTVLVCWLLSKRRGNPSPASIGEMYDEAMEEMKAVRSGDMQIPDIGARDSNFPAFSNIRVCHWYALRKARVERVVGMSDLTGNPPTRTNDDFGAFLIPPPL